MDSTTIFDSFSDDDQMEMVKSIFEGNELANSDTNRTLELAMTEINIRGQLRHNYVTARLKMRFGERAKLLQPKGNTCIFVRIYPSPGIAVHMAHTKNGAVRPADFRDTENPMFPEIVADPKGFYRTLVFDLKFSTDQHHQVNHIWLENRQTGFLMNLDLGMAGMDDDRTDFEDQAYEEMEKSAKFEPVDPASLDDETALDAVVPEATDHSPIDADEEKEKTGE